MAIPKDQFIAVTVSRERVQALTWHILTQISYWMPRLDQELAAERAQQRRDEQNRLGERAHAFYAADLLAEEAYAPAPGQERQRLFERVAEHDRILLKWARPLFGDDPRRAEILDDIQRGTGYQDSADDVVRLVAMFRGNWAEAEGKTPITRDFLDSAEADATRMFGFLSDTDGAEARDLARRAFTAWARDYRELMALGRYLARDDKDVLLRFPGIHAERAGVRRGSGEDAPEPAPGANSPAAAGPAAGPAARPGNGAGKTGGKS
jgi:hypothetical protein